MESISRQWLTCRKVDGLLKVTLKQTEQTQSRKVGDGPESLEQSRVLVSCIHNPSAFFLSMPAYATMRRPTRQACRRS